MTLSTLKRVQGVTYLVINDPMEIRHFVNSNVKAEWECDNRNDGVDSRTDDWLVSLPGRRWCLRTVKTEIVKPDPSMMAKEPFMKRLEARSDELVRSISEYHSVIWPVVLRQEDYRLKDGYCRYMALRKLRVTKIMSYVGTLRDAVPS